MPSFLSRLFSAPDAVKGAMETVKDGLDKLVYTNEEKAEAAQRASQTVVDWVSASQGSRLARRFIAVVVTSLWALFVLTWWGLTIVGSVIGDEQVAESRTFLEAGFGNVTTAFALVLGYYFAAPHLGAIAGGALRKLAGGKDEKPRS